MFLVVVSHSMKSQTVTNDTSELALRHAQETSDKFQIQSPTNAALASEADIRTFFNVTGKMETFKQLAGVVVAQQKTSNPDVPQEFWNQFQSETNLNEFIEMAIPIYQKYFTEDDVKQMIAFNASPLGQKLNNITPALTKELMQAGSAMG